MPRKPEVYHYVIPRHEVDALGVESALDMLRYDGATVESNAPQGYYLFRVEGKEPEVDRWRSFGVTTIRQFDATRWQVSEEPFLKQLWSKHQWT